MPQSNMLTIMRTTLRLKEGRIWECPECKRPQILCQQQNRPYIVLHALQQTRRRNCETPLAGLQCIERSSEEPVTTKLLLPAFYTEIRVAEEACTFHYVA